MVFCGTSCNGRYGISNAEDYDFLIVSLGRDGKEEYGWTYDPGDNSAGFSTIYDTNDFDVDIINFSGRIIRVPLYEGHKSVEFIQGIVDSSGRHADVMDELRKAIKRINR